MDPQGLNGAHAVGALGNRDAHAGSAQGGDEVDNSLLHGQLRFLEVTM
jgi:hypothetical protein